MSIPRSRSDKQTDIIIIIVLSLFVILFRLATLMIMNTGIDESDYWTAAKNLRLGLPYPELTHRTIRWSLILPVFLSQILFGIKVNVYYIIPVLAQVIQAIILYQFGKRLHSRMAGILTAFAITVFPYSARVGSQIRPEAVSIVYIMASLWFLLNYIDDQDRRFEVLIPSIAFLYLAYHAKITNLFFLPGIFLVIWILGKNLRQAFFYGAILLGLYIVETFLYALFTEFPLGHLQIITKFHINPGSSYTFTGFFALFLRYAEPYLQWYWQIPFVLFGLGAVYFLLKPRKTGVTAIIICGLSFFFFITFSALDLNPLRLLEDFINRYFYAVIGIVLMIVVMAVLDFGKWLFGKFIVKTIPVSGISGKTEIILTAFMSVFLIVAIVGSLFTASGQKFGRYYAWNPRDFSTHAIARNRQYSKLLNDALENNIPIISSSGLAGENALRTVRRFYLNEKLYKSDIFSIRTTDTRT